MKKLILTVTAVLLLALPAQAHEAEPLPPVPPWAVDAWLTEWAQEAVPSLDVPMLGDWRFMRDRYFPPPPRVQPARRVAAQDQPKPVGTTQPAYNVGVEQWRPKVALYFPADQVDRALRVMACESGGNPSAYNRSGASGLMQVLASWADNFGYQPADLFDPDINLYVASLLYFDGGWNHWVCKG